MNLSLQTPPHIRSKDSNFSMMLDVFIALIPVYCMSYYFYGKRSLYLLFLSVGISIITDFICVLMTRKIPNIKDLSMVITGMLIPLLMPVTADWYMVALAVIFAIVVAKHPFGGIGQNVFNPAVAGVAFVTICFPNEMFAYVKPFTYLPVNIVQSISSVASPAKALSLGGVPSFDLTDMFLGNVPGPMGATNILVLFSCLLYLVVRKTITFSMSGCFLLGASLSALIFPRADMTGIQSVFYEMMSGYMVITAVFLINDPVTSPKRAFPRCLYGFIAGIVAMLFRHLGRYEESILFAILVMNASVWILDLLGEYVAHYYRRKDSENRESEKAHSMAGKDRSDI